MLLVGAATGCAQRMGGDFFGKPAFDLYSRNPIVCIPTGIGNLAGVPGMLVVGPVVVAIDAAFDPDEDGVFPWIVMPFSTVLVAIPAYAGGLALGTPFVPVSFLSDEDPCDWGWH